MKYIPFVLSSSIRQDIWIGRQSRWNGSLFKILKKIKNDNNNFDCFEF